MCVIKPQRRGTTRSHECDGNLTLCCSICSSSLGAWVPTGSQFASLFSVVDSHSFSGSKVSWNCCAITEIPSSWRFLETRQQEGHSGMRNVGSCQQKASLTLLRSAPNTFCRKHLRLKWKLITLRGQFEVALLFPELPLPGFNPWLGN